MTGQQNEEEKKQDLNQANLKKQNQAMKDQQQKQPENKQN